MLWVVQLSMQTVNNSKICLPTIARKAGTPGSSWSLAILDSWVHIKGFMLALPWFPLERELLWCLPPENFLFQFLDSFLEFVRTKCRLAQDL